MKRDHPGLEPELEAFLEHRPIERRAPPEIRARALARARAIVAADGVVPPAEPAAALSVTAPRGRLRARIAMAASLAVAGAAVGAMAALHARSGEARRGVLPSRASTVPSAPPPNAGSPARDSLAPPAERAEPVAPPRPARSTTKEDSFTAELELLQRAHSAYTRHDFAVALTLVGEHARRFPKGHLAEQREALRVRSLAGAGRSDEAHRAAAAFAIQFPRSVLLSRIGSGTESAGP
jgi:hypothetical protein